MDTHDVQHIEDNTHDVQHIEDNTHDVQHIEDNICAIDSSIIDELNADINQYNDAPDVDTKENSTAIDTMATETIVDGTTVAAKLREVYGTNEELLRRIMKLFKYIFTARNKKKMLSEMTEQDIIQDICTTNLTLPNFNGSISDILEAEQSAKLFADQLAAIPVLLDFIYIYFVNCFVENAPLHHLPHNPLKFCLISDALKKYVRNAKQMEHYRRAHQQFIHIIKDPTIQEFRQEDPPLIVRTTRSIDEIRHIMFGEVREKLRDLLATVSLVECRE